MPVRLSTILRKPDDQRSVLTGVVVSRDTTAVTAVVDIDGLGTRVTVPYMNAAPSVGDVAVLIRSANRLWMLGTYGATAQPVPPEPEPDDPDLPPPPPTVTTVTLTPTATGSARGGAVRPDTRDLFQGDWTGRGIQIGQAVYAARQLSGTVQAASLRVRRLDGGVFAAQAPTFRLMTNTSLSGSPTLGSTHVGPALKIGDRATVSLPASWGQALINGTAGGIAIYVAGSSPYVRLAGPGYMTLTLRIQE